MARVILITGGSRSGKSAHAQKIAEKLRGPRLFVATCPVCDDEMQERVRMHRTKRRGRGWATVEEKTDLLAVLKGSKRYKVVLVDCLTLWVSNLLCEAEESGRTLTETAIRRRCRELLAACSRRTGTVLFVTNEVGMGVVPESALGRRFRDLAGRCNQVIAAGADDVQLLVCGIPASLKGTGNVGIARDDD